MEVDDLLFIHIGTGITVYDTTRKVGPNYKVIALINPNRTITFNEVVQPVISVAISMFAVQESPRVEKLNGNGNLVFNTLT